MKMQQGIIVPVCLLTVLLPLGAVHAGIYAASGEVTGVVTVTGTWTNVSEPAATQNTGAGMDLWSKTGYLMLDADPISGGSATSSFTHTYGSGSASLSTSVAGSPKTIDMAAEAEVHDVLAGEGYWSLAWAWDQVYMTCAQQTVTVTYDWSYALSTLLASPEDSSAYAKFSIGLANTAGSWTEKLTAKDGFVVDGLWLRKTITIAELASGSSSGSTSWTLTNLPAGNYYLYAEVKTCAATVPEPATMGLVALGGLGAIIRRRRTAR